VRESDARRATSSSRIRRVQRSPGNAGRSRTSIWQLPLIPAVYALYAERSRVRQTAFVGIADNLRQRVIEQLVIRGTPFGREGDAISLDPAFLTDLYWWEHPDFADQHVLRAAEFVAADVLQPALRSRRPISARAAELHEDEHFRGRMAALFRAEAAGHLVLPSLDRVLERLAELERRLENLTLAPWQRAGWFDP